MSTNGTVTVTAIDLLTTPFTQFIVQLVLLSPNTLFITSSLECNNVTYMPNPIPYLTLAIEAPLKKFFTPLSL